MGLCDLEGKGGGQGAVGKTAEDFGQLRPGLGAGKFAGAEAGLDARGEGLGEKGRRGELLFKLAKGEGGLGEVAAPQQGVGPAEDGFGLEGVGTRQTANLLQGRAAGGGIALGLQHSSPFEGEGGPARALRKSFRKCLFQPGKFRLVGNPGAGQGRIVKGILGRLRGGGGAKGGLISSGRLPRFSLGKKQVAQGEMRGKGYFRRQSVLLQQIEKLFPGGRLLPLFCQGLGEDQARLVSRGGEGVILDEVVEVGGGGLGVPGLQGGGSQQEEGGGKSSPLVVVIFPFTDGVAQTECGGGQGLGGLGGGQVFPGGGQKGFRVSPLVEGFFQCGGGIAGFAAGAVDSADGNPGPCEDIPTGSVRILHQGLELAAGLLVFSPGGGDFSLPVEPLGADRG